MCVCLQKKKRRNNEWVGVKVKKKSSRRLEVAAHLGIGSGAESRVRGQGERGTWACRVGGCVHVPFEMEGGLLGYQERDQMLSEDAHTICRPSFSSEKIRSRLLKLVGKLQRVSNFCDHKAHCRISSLQTIFYRVAL